MVTTTLQLFAVPKPAAPQHSYLLGRIRNIAAEHDPISLRGPRHPAGLYPYSGVG